MLQFKLLTPTAMVPQKATAGSAGYDLAPSEDCASDAAGRLIVGTGVAAAIPPGYYGRIALRSGFASRTPCLVTGGVIDSDYRGELLVLLTCSSAVRIERGQRFAQLIVERIYDGPSEVVDELVKAERRHDGFGSTGERLFK